MVCVDHFTSKLAYLMIKQNFQKFCSWVFFLIWPQRGKQNRISITGHGFSENWLPDRHLDEMRLRREKLKNYSSGRTKVPDKMKNRLRSRLWQAPERGQFICFWNEIQKVLVFKSKHFMENHLKN